MEKGAESIVIFEGNKVIKKRIPKRYRIKEFDDYLRKKRNLREVKILEKLKDVVKVPKVIEKKDFEFSMEKIDGIPLKKLNIDNKEFWRKLGQGISKIHNFGVIHGDLTTKNVLIKGNDIYFIDFGLAFFSNKIEDKAMDLIVLKDILTLEGRGDKFNLILEGYQSNDKQEIIKRIEKIEERGRYKRKS